MGPSLGKVHWGKSKRDFGEISNVLLKISIYKLYWGYVHRIMLQESKRYVILILNRNKAAKIPFSIEEDVLKIHYLQKRTWGKTKG